MTNILNTLLEDQDIETQLLKNYIKQKTNSIFEIVTDIQQCTWGLTTDLEPIVYIEKEFLFKVHSENVKTLFDIIMFDPFYGVIPHEVEEANITIEICRGGIDRVLQKYPRYFMTHSMYQDLKQLSLKDYQIYDNFASPDKISRYEYVAGEAHEIIISPDPSGYNNFIDKHS